MQEEVNPRRRKGGGETETNDMKIKSRQVVLLVQAYNPRENAISIELQATKRAWCERKKKQNSIPGRTRTNRKLQK